MKSGKIRIVVLCITLIAILSAPFIGLAASAVTLVGEVNDSFQIVSNGQHYDIADTTKGNDLAENYIGEKVKVTGTVEKDGDEKIIQVTGFEVMAE